MSQVAIGSPEAWRERGRGGSVAPTTGDSYARRPMHASAECNAMAGRVGGSGFTPPVRTLGHAHTRTASHRKVSEVKEGAWKRRLSRPEKKDVAEESRKQKKKERERGEREGKERDKTCVHACRGVSRVYWWVCQFTRVLFSLQQKVRAEGWTRVAEPGEPRAQRGLR